MVSQLSTLLQTPVSAHDHVRGSRSAVVSLVEYGDFECPYCRAALEIVTGLQNALGDQLSFTFRHFPMRDVHPHAQHAAEITEAAAAQGHFWEMHVWLFTEVAHLEKTGHQLTLAQVLAQANRLGLNLPRFRRDLNSAATLRAIARQKQLGDQLKIAGAPTFFVLDPSGKSTRYEGVGELRRWASDPANLQEKRNPASLQPIINFPWRPVALDRFMREQSWFSAIRGTLAAQSPRYALHHAPRTAG